jgi:hypothetical protein
MRTRTLARKLDRLEALARAQRANHSALLEQLRADPDRLMSLAGLAPDAWQAQVLRSAGSRVLLLCSRQSGKSTVAAALALRMALLEPRSSILILSASDRQSGELFRKILDAYRLLDRPVPAVAESLHHLQLINGSRILALPGTEKTVRCFGGIALLIIDEAARVEDALYRAVRPMLAVSHGRLIALSTPFGKRGWYYEAWQSREVWQRLRITAADCPRITTAFLAEEQQALGERWYRQEYFCSFEEAVDAVFREEDIQAALRDDIRPLFAW